MSRLTDKIAEMALPIVTGFGLDLWDVEFTKEGGEQFLRIFIDSDEGVFIDQCVSVSRALEKILDEEDPIDGSYTLEVSSAGAERQLKRPSDFEKFLGHLVEVKLYRGLDGKKQFLGTLLARDEETLKLDEGGETREFSTESVASVRLRIDMASL
ncbi:ribosome maturation factor RimP [Oscillospiraceae bacterium OttesenSCG-928-G22]|nr:ribosome maturation factor RimP [Oscillospiraceae bacterium OttesenSCG-928-G22]